MSSSRQSLIEMDIDKWVSGHSVDCVVLGFDDPGLKVLLLRWRETEFWSLPGGMIEQTEHLDDAARRVLLERTGLKDPFLNQFHTFGNYDRRKLSDQPQSMAQMLPEDEKIQNWFKQRFITSGYYALANIEQSRPTPDELSDKVEWVSVDRLPELIFDHKEIIDTAIAHIRTRLSYLPIGRTVLPEKFTMGELQRLYEAFLGRSLDRGNFQRKILKLNFLQRHEKLLSGGAHKAPYLYSFDQDAFDQLSEKGIGFI